MIRDVFQDKTMYTCSQIFGKRHDGQIRKKNNPMQNTYLGSIFMGSILENRASA